MAVVSTVRDGVEVARPGALAYSFPARPAKRAYSLCHLPGGFSSMMLGGSVVTEAIFACPAVGLLSIEAALRKDYPV